MSQKWKIYTKKGDKGSTSLIGGKRVPKYHERIEAYGTLDELNSYLGVVRDQDISDEIRKIIIEIQDRVFTAESLLASELGMENPDLPKLYEKDVELLENEIDKMNEELPELTNFILPGGHRAVSHCHVARCICRRAERATIKLTQSENIDELIIKYLNRLSDYLFVLARKISLDQNAVETPWKARL